MATAVPYYDTLGTLTIHDAIGHTDSQPLQRPTNYNIPLPPPNSRLGSLSTPYSNKRSSSALNSKDPTMPKAAKFSIRQMAEKAVATGTSVDDTGNDRRLSRQDHDEPMDESRDSSDNDVEFSYPPPAPEGNDTESEISHLLLSHPGASNDGKSQQPPSQPENAAEAYQQLVYGSFKQPLGNSQPPAPAQPFQPKSTSRVSSAASSAFNTPTRPAATSSAAASAARQQPPASKLNMTTNASATSTPMATPDTSFKTAATTPGNVSGLVNTTQAATATSGLASTPVTNGTSALSSTVSTPATNGTPASNSASQVHVSAPSTSAPRPTMTPASATPAATAPEQTSTPASTTATEQPVQTLDTSTPSAATVKTESVSTAAAVAAPTTAASTSAPSAPAVSTPTSASPVSAPLPPKQDPSVSPVTSTTPMAQQSPTNEYKTASSSSRPSLTGSGEGQLKSEDCPICHRNFKGPKASTHKQQHIRRLHPAHYIPKRGGKKRASDVDSPSQNAQSDQQKYMLTNLAQQAAASGSSPYNSNDNENDENGDEESSMSPQP